MRWQIVYTCVIPPVNCDSNFNLIIEHDNI